MGTRWTFAAVAAGIVATAPLGWVVTDHLERDNDFCTACHLEADVPLHSDIRRDFDALPPVSLAGRHGSAAVEGRAEPAFRCIDCHGGAGLLGRARVKALAARDAFWYVVGRFEEPSGMRWPLWDEDCVKCHASFDVSELRAGQSSRFHQLPVHNADLGVACVQCHLTHEAGGNPEAWFIHAAHVRTQCAVCHAEFEEGEG